MRCEEESHLRVRRSTVLHITQPQLPDYTLRTITYTLRYVFFLRVWFSHLMDSPLQTPYYYDTHVRHVSRPP